MPGGGAAGAAEALATANADALATGAEDALATAEVGGRGGGASDAEGGALDVATGTGAGAGDVEQAAKTGPTRKTPRARALTPHLYRKRARDGTSGA